MRVEGKETEDILSVLVRKLSLKVRRNNEAEKEEILASGRAAVTRDAA